MAAEEQKRFITLDEYKIQIHPEINSGSFGAIFQAWTREDKKIAVKRVPLLCEEEAKSYARSEAEIMRQLNDNKHFLNVYHVKEESKHLYIFMDYCELGNLQQYMRKTFLEEDRDVWERYPILLQIADGVHFLHSKGLVHRDLKPQNILVARKGICDEFKITDFGMSKFIQSKIDLLSKTAAHQRTKQFMTTMCGTLSFMAPELFCEYIKYDESVDIFALGLVFKTILEFSETKLNMNPVVDGVDTTLAIGQYMERHPDQLVIVMPIEPSDVEEIKALKELVGLMTAKKADQRPNSATTLANLQERIAISSWLLLFLHDDTSALLVFYVEDELPCDEDNEQAIEVFEDVVLDRALKFLEWKEDSEKKAKINTIQPTLEILEQIHKPFASIAIVGPYRAGKSYFLNKMAKKSELFKTSDEYKACTEGVWIWITKHPQEDQYIILFDTEGLYDATGNEAKKDACCKIFALMSLLSSQLILYNRHHIDSNALRDLQFVTEYVKSRTEGCHPHLAFVFRSYDYDPNKIEEHLNKVLQRSEKQDVQAFFSYRTYHPCKNDQVEECALELMTIAKIYPNCHQSDSGKGYVELIKTYTKQLNKWNGKRMLLMNTLHDICNPVLDKYKDAMVLFMKRWKNETPRTNKDVIDESDMMKELDECIGSSFDDYREFITVLQNETKDSIRSESFHESLRTENHKQWERFFDAKIADLNFYLEGKGKSKEQIMLTLQDCAEYFYRECSTTVYDECKKTVDKILQEHQLELNDTEWIKINLGGFVMSLSQNKSAFGRFIALGKEKIKKLKW